METVPRTHKFRLLIEERKAALRPFVEQLPSDDSGLVFEMGCGHGHFLVAYAQAHPDAQCLGLDIDGDRIDRASRKQQRAKLTNLRFVQADALLFLEILPAHLRFSRVFVLFPDPWPKKRHHKNRLLQAPFLTAVHRHATERTRIFFRTDFDPYFEHASAAFIKHPAWELVIEAWPFEHETVFQSRAASHRSLIARPRFTLP